MDLLEKFAPKKKKPLVLSNVRKKAGGITYPLEKGGGGSGGDYIPTGLKISEPSVLGKKKKKNPGINHGQPAGKGRKKTKKKKKKRSCVSVRRGFETQNQNLDKRTNKQRN
jgi:hypothetical protein